MYKDSSESTLRIKRTEKTMWYTAVTSDFCML